MTLLHLELERRDLALRLLNLLADSAPTEDHRPRQLVWLSRYEFFDDPSALALLHLLQWLGAVHLDEQLLTAEVVSPQAGYLLRLLHELLLLKQPLVADWQREGLTPPKVADRTLLDHLSRSGWGQAAMLPHIFSSGVDLLAALEQRRLELDEQAHPLRVLSAAVGLIVRRDRSGARSYLLVYDEQADAWQLPGGRFEQSDGSLRQTLLRELAEELHCLPLAEPSDLHLDELGCPFAETRLSPTYGLLTRTLFQPFLVQFAAGKLPSLHDGLRWFSESEVLAGWSADRQLISAPALRHLRESGDLGSLLA
jgi:8-oxo-dGTP pyrophosphatase MutT (NUDIX family)